MGGFIKHYGLTIALLAGMAAGGLCGHFSPEAAHAIRPVGEAFINLVFVLVVPLVFFSIAQSFIRMHRSGLLGKMMGRILLVFAVMSIVAGAVALLGTRIYPPVTEAERVVLQGAAGQTATQEGNGLAEAIVGALTVPDFRMLFSKDHLLALIVFAALLGYATARSGEKGAPLARVIESGAAVTTDLVRLLMKAAPVGLGCWFASTVAGAGTGLLAGYVRVVILFLAMTAVFFLVINSLYIFLARGRKGLAAFWQSIWPAAVTAVATASSAVAMPPAIEAAKRAGAAPEIADATLPLGTNLHKSGSILAGVCKVMFLMLLFSHPVSGFGTACAIFGLAILESLLMGAIPTGGFSGEVFLCSILGFPPEAVGLIIVISTLVDIPATLLNTQGNIVAALLVDALSGKDSHSA